MKLARLLSIPLLSAILLGLPVVWAWPAGLPLWRSLGIVLGWAGCGLLLASLLLMLRESWLAERLGGLERMYAWHHVLGTLAYLLLLAHPLALAVDNLAESPGLAWALLSPLTQGWPLWFGWLGLLCLMLGMAASFSRRLPYPLWRGLHALLAVAILFGCLHLWLLGLGPSFFFMLLLSLLFLGWRFLRIDSSLAARPYLVSQVQRVAADIVEIALRPLGMPITARPGQFVLVGFGDGDTFRGCGECHPYTICAVDPEGHLRISIKALGDCTRHLQTVEIGVPVGVQGPFGDFLLDRPPLPQFWLAGGIGLTPFLAVLRDERLMQPTQLFYFYRRPEDGAYVEELRTLAARQPSLTMHVHCGDFNAATLAGLLPDSAALAGRIAFLCGPPGLLGNTAEILGQRGMAPASIHFECFDFR